MTLDKTRIRQIVTDVVAEKLGGAPRPAADSVDSGARRQLITEADVMAAHRARRSVVMPSDAIVTPLARDAIERYRVPVASPDDGRASVERVRDHATQAAAGGASKSLLAIASDHGGFELKQTLLAFLTGEAGITCEDMGTHSADPVDYPDYAQRVAEAVASGRACRGIVIDGAGIGSCMAANKVRGVRAAHCANPVEARNAREHNDANVLTLGGRMIGVEVAKAIAIVFVKTDFGGGRHQGRVDKIMKLER